VSGRVARPVRAGSLSAYLGANDVRYLCLDDNELVRRMHVAVRDTRWGTVPLGDAHARVGRPAGGFSLAFGGRCRSEGLDLELECSITGSAGGRVEFAMDCHALSASDYNRIGICVLLPSELAGWPSAAGSQAQSDRWRLPIMVGPQRIEGGRIHALMPPFTHFEVKVASGIGMSLDFAGDEFEIEDQRNWADASFKIYSTPLARGFPFRLEAGGSLRQSVVLSTWMSGERSRRGKAVDAAQASLIRAQA
jgi:D-apionolactonase